MVKVSAQPAGATDVAHEEIDLKDPNAAALIGWLVPGLGHIYQGRTGKGILLMVCILTTYFFGLWLGGGRVVYASWRPEDRRLPFICQAPIGVAAFPALLQAYRVKSNHEPWFNGIMAPPPLEPTNNPDQLTLNQIHYYYHRYFELGTVYTMIAGLLNVLAILDAWRGPALLPDERSDRAPPDEDGKDKDNVDSGSSTAKTA